MIKNYSVTTGGVTIAERSDVDDTEVAVLTVFFCNYSGTDRTITVYLKEVGNATNDNAKIILKEETIEAGKTWQFDAGEKIILKGHTAAASRNGMVAVASADSAITATVSTKNL